MVEAVKEEKMEEFDNRRERIRENQTNKQISLNRKRRKAKMKRTRRHQNLTPSSHVILSIILYT